MAFEKKVPEWNASGTEPADTLKNKGFEPGYKPPADTFNWFWHGVSEALSELQDKATSENIIETTAGTDLNDFNTVDYLGPWHCGGTNDVQNKPAGVDSFSLMVMRTATGYFTQVLTAGNRETNKTFMRTYGAGSWSDWEEFAFTSGNVASASKLENARKINGIPFDGTEDITVGCIGYEPIKTTEDDTVANWKALGSGYAVYTTTRLNGQPTDYGFVVQYVYNSLLYQEFHSMPTGGTWYRKGNNTGWWSDSSNKGVWRVVYDEYNKPEKLKTARNINGVPFDGTENIEINPIATLIDSTRDMDLNAYSTIGHIGFWYAVGGNDIANKPDGVDAFGLLVMRSASGYFMQILTASSKNTNIIYNRTFTGSQWTNWAGMYSTGNKPTPEDIGVIPVKYGGTGATNLTGLQKAVLNNQALTETTDLLTLPNGFYHREGNVSTEYGWPYDSDVAKAEVFIWGNRNGSKGYWSIFVVNVYSGKMFVNTCHWGEWKGWKQIYNSGEVIPVTGGGTGATTARAAEYNICNDMTPTINAITDDTLIVSKRVVTANTMNGALTTKTAALLWNYIAAKIEATYNVTKK